MYGSPRTIRLLAMYQQENYLNQGEVDTSLSMAYIAEIISSLKYDFSGYKVDPLSLVSIKINDMADCKI